MNAADLRDAPALAFLPERLRRVRGRVFVMGGVVQRRPLEILEAEAIDADGLIDREDGCGDAAE